jgi:hypothetical protein
MWALKQACSQSLTPGSVARLQLFILSIFNTAHKQFYLFRAPDRQGQSGCVVKVP